MADEMSSTFEGRLDIAQHMLLYLCTLLELEDNWVSGMNGEDEDRISWEHRTPDGVRLPVAPASNAELQLMLRKLEKKISAGKDWRTSEVNKKMRSIAMPLISRNLQEMRQKARKKGFKTLDALKQSSSAIFQSMKNIEGRLTQEPHYPLGEKRGLDLDELAKHAKHLLRGCKRLKTQKTEKKAGSDVVVIDLDE